MVATLSFFAPQLIPHSVSVLSDLDTRVKPVHLGLNLGFPATQGMVSTASEGPSGTFTMCKLKRCLFLGSGKLAWQVRALVVLAEDQGSGPSTRVVALDHL